MPLFESQDDRNERLFDSSFREVYHRVAESLNDGNQRRASLAWVFGGFIAAQSIVDNCDFIKESWGKGDENKAKAMAEVFTLHMASEWYRSLDQHKQVSPDQRRRGCEVSVLNVAYFFGREIDEDNRQPIDSFLNMDKQYNVEVDEGGRMPYYGPLLLAKAREACCQRFSDWSTVTFPVRSMETLLGEQPTIQVPNLIDNLAGWVAVCEATKAMFEHFRQLSNEK